MKSACLVAAPETYLGSFLGDFLAVQPVLVALTPCAGHKQGVGYVTVVGRFTQVSAQDKP